MKSNRHSFSAPGIAGEIVAKFGRHFLVRVDGNRTLSCILRGRRNDAACGDHVEVRLAGAAQGVIEAVLPRTSLLYRSDAAHEKLVAANVTQVIIVIGAIPSFSEELLNRCLIAAENERLSVLIVLNKSDLVEPAMAALVTLELYRNLGYPVLPLSATASVEPLLPFLNGQLSVLIGQSGMGKSTIINTLIPSATRATGGWSCSVLRAKDEQYSDQCHDRSQLPLRPSTVIASEGRPARKGEAIPVQQGANDNERKSCDGTEQEPGPVCVPSRLR